MVNILVVEDNHSLLRLYGRLLKSITSQVVLASTLREAFEYLSSTTPNILLLDLGMPDGNGVSVLEHLRDASSLEKCEILVVSGNAHQKEEAKGFGVKHFFMKPASMITILEVVQDIAHHHTKHGTVTE